MPGVDDPDIVIDPTPLAFHSGQGDNAPAAGQPPPAIRTLGAIGSDTMATLFVAAAGFGLFHPLGKIGVASVAISCICLMASTTLCFFERGLYAATEINNPSPNWKLIGVAWVQAVATSALLLSFPALASGPATGSPADLADILRSPWLPAVLFGGMPAIVATRFLLGRCFTSRDLNPSGVCRL